MVECLLKLCVKTYHIMQAHKNTFAVAVAQAQVHTDTHKHTETHTTIIIISCAETDRKMHVVIQSVKMVLG